MLRKNQKVLNCINMMLDATLIFCAYLVATYIRFDMMYGATPAEIFDFCCGPHGAQLRALGDAMGRLFYLLDAWEDLPQDTRAGVYNPLAHLADCADFEAQCRAMIDRQRQLALDALDKLPMHTDCALAERLLLSLTASQTPLVSRRRPARRTV